jgi:hypothetical protein
MECTTNPLVASYQRGRVPSHPRLIPRCCSSAYGGDGKGKLGKARSVELLTLRSLSDRWSRTNIRPRSEPASKVYRNEPRCAEPSSRSLHLGVAGQVERVPWIQSTGNALRACQQTPGSSLIPELHLTSVDMPLGSLSPRSIGHWTISP